MEIATGLLSAPPDGIDEDGFDDGGHAWIARLRPIGWVEVGVWGRDGWNLGTWPYMVVAHFDGPEGSGLAQHVEGDVTVEAFDTVEARDAATDAVALFHWQQFGNCPQSLPHTVDELPEQFRGPYRA